MPRIGEPWRLVRVILITLTLTLIPLFLAIITITGSLSNIWGDILSPGTTVITTVLLAFVIGRVILLRRAGICSSGFVCFMQTVRQSAFLLTRVLVVVYFILLLGQLPFRAAETKWLHMQLTNEVQMIMSSRSK